jgi:hypothetical protein
MGRLNVKAFMLVLMAAMSWENNIFRGTGLEFFFDILKFIKIK